MLIENLVQFILTDLGLLVLYDGLFFVELNLENTYLLVEFVDVGVFKGYGGFEVLGL